MEKDILENKNIAIVGYGNMGKAIVQCLLGKKIIKRSQLFISNSADKNATAIIKSQIIFLCIKPQDMVSVITDMADITGITITSKLFISIAAGISIKIMEKYLGNKTKIIRVMPNLCARVGESMSCWMRNKQVSFKEAKIIKSVLESFGHQLEVEDENDLNKITAISGSGPAYFFYFVEAFMESAHKLGLNDEMSKLLIIKTLKGALLTLSQSKKSVQELRTQVTSKGGTTAAAINILEEQKFKEILVRAIYAAYNRSIELSNY